MSDEPLSEIDRTISALQDPTRRRVLLDFYVDRPEWTAAKVAEAVGVTGTETVAGRDGGMECSGSRPRP